MLDKPLLFQIFEQQIHAGVADAAADAGLGSTLLAGLGMPATIATGLMDTASALSARRRLRTWVRAGRVKPFGEQPADVMLFDLAGISLVHAIHVCREASEEGPQRQLRHIAAALRGAVGGHEGKAGLDGAGTAMHASLLRHVERTALPMYRNFLLTALQEMRGGGISQSARRAAERTYLATTLAGAGTAAVPPRHPLAASRTLGVVITQAAWHDGLSAQPEPRPQWPGPTLHMLRGGDFDQLLGIADD